LVDYAEICLVGFHPHLLQADDEFPPPPPMRSADSSLNDSHLNDSNSTTQSNVTSECSEAECDREPLVKDSRGE
jgi:hypothetical protein